MSAPEVIHKFGRNPAVGTTYAPITPNGIYHTPQVAGATKVRVAAGNAADAPGGLGARCIHIYGLNELGYDVDEIIETNGVLAGPESVNTYIRVFRMHVEESGVYATQAAGSHVGDIVLEEAEDVSPAIWATMLANSYPNGQSEIACYTIPTDRTGYISAVGFTADTPNKIVECIFYQRKRILDTAPPYDAMRAIIPLSNINNEHFREFSTPYGPFYENTDILVMAKIDAGTTEVHVDFHIILFDETQAFGDAAWLKS